MRNGRVSMVSISLGVALLITSLQAGCRGPTWQVGASLIVTNRQVREALRDPVVGVPEAPFNPNSVPLFDAPGKTRPCCPFGMDLKVKLGVTTVPGYQKDNIIGIDDIGKHEYDNGFFTVQAEKGRSLISENNALLYTCRGGFIDVAHIRDNADLTLFLAMRIARELPGGVTIKLPGQGTERRVVVKPIPEAILKYYGRVYASTAMAQYLAYYLSVWHEVVTWYDWQSVKGFSEKLSAFSPEDSYSNVLGILLASGVIRNQGAQSRDDYNRSLDAWIPAALRRLGVVTQTESRAAMKAVDGLWWNSQKEIPDSTLTMRRNMELKMPIVPWIVTDVVPANKSGLDPLVHKMCAEQPEPLDLAVTERLGNVKFSDVLDLELEFTDWKPETFPYPNGNKVAHIADLPGILAAIRKEVIKELGPGADSPKPVTNVAQVATWLAAQRSAR